MTHSRIRSAVALLVPLALVACGGGEILIEETRDDDLVASRTIEGDALVAELASSPVQEAPLPFVRLGLLWDAPGSADLEVSVSSDGQTWSDFAAAEVASIEAEGTASLVGSYEVAGDPALYYRLRAAGGVQPTFVHIEFLEHTLVESLEDGGRVAEDDEGVASATFALSVGGVAVNARSAWGARAPRCASNHTPNRITIHHTVTPTSDSMSPQARLRQIQSFHQNVRGWCDIGYQYLVSRDGRLWEGRGARRLGTHVANNNTGNVGISVMGTHTTTPATDTQLTQIARLVRGLASTYGIAITSSKIKGHRDYGGTECPGGALYAKLGTIRSRAAASGGGGGGTTPPPGGTTVKGLIYKGSNTGARIAGATVKLGSRTTTSNAEGYYQFTGVAAGSYTITASKSGFNTRSIQRAVSGSETWGSVGLSAVATSGNAKLIGVVYRGSNSADRIGGATIKLSNGRTATANAEGYYEITGLAAGRYTITASRSGFTSRSITRDLPASGTTWGSVSL
jgi:hypothetical protein